MAKDNNVVVVAVNYRLAALGFLALPSLAATNGQVGNMGLLDQRLGMQWVQENIEAFGGDKTRVAIFGESAGGFSVCWHLVSPGSRGLFSSAIMESGTCESHGFFAPVEQAYAFGNRVAASVRCNGSGSGQLDCLRSLSIDELLKSNLTTVPIIGDDVSDVPGLHTLATNSEVQSFGRHAGFGTTTPLTPEMAPIMPWTAVIDGINLLKVPLQSLRENDWAKVPVLFGTNKNEGSIFVPALMFVVPGTDFPPTTQQMLDALPHFFGHYTTNATAVKVASENTMKMYPLSNYDDNKWHRAARIMRDWFFTCATRRAATAITENGGSVYLYQFTQKLPWLEYDILGDFHGSEVDVVWGYQSLLRPFNSDVTSLSEAMQKYWTSMARNGSPNSGSADAPLKWPVYDTTTRPNMNLTWPLDTQTMLNADLCDFWDDTLSSFHHST